MHKRGGARRRRILPFDPPGRAGKAHIIPGVLSAIRKIIGTFLTQGLKPTGVVL